MIDERILADPLRCPSCGSPVDSPTRCPTCAVNLTGPTAARLWQVSLEAAQLLGERARLIEALRSERVALASPSGVVASPTAAATAGAVAAPTAAAPSDAGLSTPPAPRPEWTPRRVQNLLLTLGVGLLAVAAVIFLVVSWSLLGIGGRATVMAGCTVLAGAAAAVAHRRGLGATAEAVSLLTVGLALLDAVGARQAGLAGFDRGDGLVYWAGALSVVAALGAATSRVVPTRSLRMSAAALAQLPVLLITVHLARTVDQPVAVVAAGLTLSTVGALGVAAAWPSPSPSRDARIVVAAGGLLAWLAACGAAVAAAYGEAGSLLLGTALLLVLSGVAAASVRLGDRFPLVPTLASAAAAGLVVAAAWAPVVDQVSGRWVPVVLSLVAGGLLVAAAGVPVRYRSTPAAVTLFAALAPAVAALEAVAVSAGAQVAWLAHPWEGARGASARTLVADVLVNRDPGYLTSPPTWGVEVPLLLLVAAAVCVAADRLHHQVPRLGLGALPLVALAVLTSPAALDLSFAAALGLDLASAALLVAAGAWCVRRAMPEPGAVSLGTGLTLLALTVAWSLAVDVDTLVTLLVAALLLAAAAVLAPAASLRLPLGVSAALAAIAQAAAVARFEGGRWPAVWSLALTLGVVAAALAAGQVPGVVRRGFAVCAAALLAADAVALTLWSGGSVATAGLVAAVVSATLLGVAVWADAIVTTLDADWREVSLDVAVTGAAGATAGVVLAALDVDRLWLALLALGVAAAVAALRPDLHRVGWLAGVLLTASSWVRLALSDVDAPEPYTVPAGLALLALGAWRRRRDPAYPSWRAYATGLTLMLVPSLVRAVSDAGNVRPLLLALAALLVLCSGLARRLQAPLVIGGLVLAIDALVQLAPFLVGVYDAVPRWSLLALIGLALVVLGATYERRARELRALQQQIASFG